MSSSSNARKQRRALKAAGVVVMDRVVIEADAIAKAKEKGANIIELVAMHVGHALARVDAKGGHVLDHCVVTIGQHPDFPNAVTIEAKVASRKVPGDA